MSIRLTLNNGLKPIVLILSFLLISVLPVSAQRVVTDDEVNAIAKTLYCPVCENVPLDVCGTAACADWRYEIRLQLESGRTAQEITDDFVRRFGDRVVGTPQDGLLRALSLLTPLAGVVAALLVAVYVASRRAKSKQVVPPQAADDDYEAMLERDLAG
jgi:cytochrome c-type biogenesis protein CcmH